MRRRRPVWKDVAQMAAAAAAMHFRPRHAMAAVIGVLDGAFEGIVKTRPAGAALEFLFRREERPSASRANKYARPLFMVEDAASRCLSAMRAHDPILFRRKQTPPFFIGMGHVKQLALHDTPLPWACESSLTHPN